MDATQSAEEGAPLRLHDALVLLFRSWREDDRVPAAQRWADAIHAAFYAPPTQRGASMSKFQELEAVLTHVFDTLCQRHGGVRGGDDAAQLLWTFVVDVVLLLAQEQSPPPVDRQDRRSDSAAHHDSAKQQAKKAKKKRAQPYTPLAFVVLCALKKVASPQESGDSCGATTSTTVGVRSNAALRAFCQRGLANPETVDQKLLVEILDLFQLAHFDAALVLAACGRHVRAKSFSAAVKLCALCRHAQWPFEDIVKAMTQAKDWVSAELLVRNCERPNETSASAVSATHTAGLCSCPGSHTSYPLFLIAALAKMLIDEAIALREFKRARRLVEAFSLAQDYPDLETFSRRDGLVKLIETQRWQLALSFVGNDAALQRTLFEHAVSAGEIALARSLASRLGITDFEPNIAHIASQTPPTTASPAPASKFLQLYLENGRSIVTFCDEEEHTRDAMEHFFADKDNEGRDSVDGGDRAASCTLNRVVGLDVEWKPTTARASSSGAIASILQIATPTRVFIIDLLTLHDSAFLFDVFLLRLFTSKRYLKVGFGFESDMKGSSPCAVLLKPAATGSHYGYSLIECAVLHQTFPERKAFFHVAPFVELNALVQTVYGASAGSSLSSATTQILGKPLDKFGHVPVAFVAFVQRMQVSNWEDRPLSMEQVHYAALDAQCLVQIVRKLSTDTMDESAQASLSSCSRLRKSIVTLHTPSALSDEAAATATQWRHDYVREWRQQLNQRKRANAASNSLTPQDVAQFWNERKAIFLKEANEAQVDTSALDMEIKLLPSKTVQQVLADAQRTYEPREFMHINSICFFANGKPCVACIDATRKLDTAQLALLCGVKRRKIKLATAIECVDTFGFPPGTVPPFGHRPQTRLGDPKQNCTQRQREIPVYVDSSLKNAAYLLGGGGSRESFVWVSSAAFFRLIEAERIGNISLRKEMESNPTPDRAISRHVSEQVTLENDTSEGSQVAVYRFVADTMVSQVARWLRVIGVDVVTWRPEEDDTIATSTAKNQSHRARLLAFASGEQRIVITRDAQLASRRDAGACFVLSSDVCYKQFREIKTQFGLYARKKGSKSRCARCNSTEFVTVDVEYVRTQTHEVVQAKVLETVTNFWMCVQCDKIYWEGPKYTTTTTTTTSDGAKDGEVVYQPTHRKRNPRTHVP